VIDADLTLLSEDANGTFSFLLLAQTGTAGGLAATALSRPAGKAPKTRYACTLKVAVVQYAVPYSGFPS
jgi:hypothetical protein